MIEWEDFKNRKCYKEKTFKNVEKDNSRLVLARDKHNTPIKIDKYYYILETLKRV